MSRPSVVVIGDSVLEVTVAPSEPMRQGADARAHVGLGPGGQGANVAVRLARHRVAVRLLTALGEDAAGRLVRAAIEMEGVELRARTVGRTGIVVCLIGLGAERTMLSDRVAFESDAVDALLSDVREAAWLHVSGYLLRGAGAPALASALRAACGERGRVSLAGGSVPPGPEAAAFRAALINLRPDLLVLGRDEAAAVANPPDAPEPIVLAEALATFATVAVVTAGGDGSAVAGVAGFAVPAAGDERAVIDSTGAGDAYVAALIRGLMRGPWPPAEDRLRTATEAAARAGAAAARVWGAQGRTDDER